MTTVLLIMLGGTIGFFVAALCKVASKADREMEILEVQENNIDEIELTKTEANVDLAKESIEIEKETIV